MAANANAMRSSLGRCGFNPETADFLFVQGFAQPSDFLLVTETDIHSMIRNTSRQPPVNVIFPFLAVKKLIAYRFWTAERTRTAGTVTPDAFTAAECTRALTELRNSEEREESSKDVDPVKVEALKTITGWFKWNEKWLNLLSQLRGRAKTPIVYVIRDVADVTDAVREAEYSDSDERLIATTLLSGDHYIADNKRVWRELKALTVDGAGWTYIKRFNKKEDGREAYLALKRQCEGDSASLTRKARAYNKISKAKYSGERQNYDFQKYVEAHQSAYNEILDVDPNEAIPETKRVQDFLAGINDGAGIQSGIDFVLGNPLYMGSFEQTQQYLGTLVASRKEHQSAKGNHGGVSAIEAKSKNLDGHWYSKEEWRQLTPDQQAKVRELQKKNKDRKTKKSEKKKRKAAAAKKKQKQASKNEEASSSSEDEHDRQPSDNAGDQFGRAGHKKPDKKKKKSE